MTVSNNKEKIREHYDALSPYYHSLWGDHIHHGYWIRGDESKEVAQLQLVERLAQTAGLPPDCKILDVGCGIGAASIYLAQKYGADVTGITISPVQLEMAKQAAAKQDARVKFLLMDAEALELDGSFDVIWAVESVSHFRSVPRFFESAADLLRVNGTIALIDWFKREELETLEERRFVAPIERSMLVKLRTMRAYGEWMEAHGLRVVHRERLNEHCARTWEICLEFLKEKKFWELAAKHGSRFVAHLRGFRAMRAGFASGNFVYGMMVARKM